MTHRQVLIAASSLALALAGCAAKSSEQLIEEVCQRASDCMGVDAMSCVSSTTDTYERVLADCPEEEPIFRDYLDCSAAAGTCPDMTSGAFVGCESEFAAVGDAISRCEAGP